MTKSLYTITTSLITKSSIGLGNVDNTSDVNKPVSTAQAAADAAVAAASTPIAHVGAGGGAHANVIAAGASGFMTGADKTKLDAISGTNTGDETGTTIRSKLGATTLGTNLYTIPNPSAVTYFRVNADNTVSALDASTFRTAIGAGTVTSVSGTGTVSGLTLSGTVTGSGSLTLGGAITGFLTAETDTLATVTNRGATTTGSIVVNGSVSATAAGGFISATYIAGRNPIWRFGNADQYGISYFQSTGGIGGLDTIGLHFGTATAVGSQFQFISNGNLNVQGVLSAAAKNFLIKHPTKEGKQLRHGSLEGPENGVYVRGKTTSKTIELPEYWTKLVNPNSITVALTPIGRNQGLYVEAIKNNTITVGSSKWFGGVEYFYTVYGERIDVEKLQVES